MYWFLHNTFKNLSRCNWALRRKNHLISSPEFFLRETSLCCFYPTYLRLRDNEKGHRRAARLLTTSCPFPDAALPPSCWRLGQLKHNHRKSHIKFKQKSHGLEMNRFCLLTPWATETQSQKITHYVHYILRRKAHGLKVGSSCLLAPWATETVSQKITHYSERASAAARSAASASEHSCNVGVRTHM